jgi:hypothetical protein
METHDQQDNQCTQPQQLMNYFVDFLLIERKKTKSNASLTTRYRSDDSGEDSIISNEKEILIPRENH